MKWFASLLVVAALLTCGLNAPAGPESGKWDRVATLSPNSSQSFTDTFKPNERVTVIVIGNGKTDLDLFIRDESGNVVASDTDNTDDCAVILTPSTRSRYTIEVKNLGNVENRYRIVVK